MMRRTLPAFTLVETLIAVAVVSLAIVGPFHIAQGVLQSSYVARDQLVASALAQEALEYVHSVRDGNFIYNIHTSGTRPWLYGLDGSTYGGITATDCYGNNCVIDVGQQTAQIYNSSNCRTGALYLSPAHLYNQACSGTATKFTRTIRLTSISATETHVVVTVTWVSHGATYAVTLTENLRNWL